MRSWVLVGRTSIDLISAKEKRRCDICDLDQKVLAVLPGRLERDEVAICAACCNSIGGTLGAKAADDVAASA